MNRLLVSTAIGVFLAMAPAMAETQAPAGNTAVSPAPQSQVAPSNSPAAFAPEERSGGNGAQFIQAQNDSDWLATNVIGKPVVNAQNQSIGDVNDLVTDQSGKIVAAVIGVGGFLGIGEKNVAVPYEDLKLTRNEDGRNVQVMLNMSKESLAQAPNFQTLDQRVAQSKTESDRGRRTY